MKSTFRERIFEVIIYLILAVFLLTVLIPLVVLISSSLESKEVLMVKGMVLFPGKVSFDTYKYIFTSRLSGNVSLINAVGYSVLRTFLGASLAVGVQFLIAYGITQSYIRGHKFIVWLLIIPMFIGGGLIPTYLVIKGLGMFNSYAVLIILGCVSPYNVFLMRGFLEDIPKEYSESAFIDGANELDIFFKIIVPLSTAALATFWLFAAVSQWSDWFNAMIYLNDVKKFPLQLVIQQLISDSIIASNEAFRNTNQAAVDKTPVEVSLKCAAIVVSTLPILMIYPFLQKYFVKGLTMGGVKG